MRWAEMTVVCAAEATDAVSYAFIEAGCGGVMLTGKDPVTVQGSLPVTDELMLRVTGLKAHLDRLEEFGLPALLDGMTLRYAEEEDWANAWKQYFKPLRIGKRLIVKPSWEYYLPTGDDLVLELDPGMAFGTGGHPTTRLCMEALEERMTPGMVVADIGTGSGILSLAAARLGAVKIWATDSDLLPRKIAKENIARNGLEDVIEIMELEPFDTAAHDCDLVVANIVANTIIELAPTIAPRLKPGGIFIGSGIVEEHHDNVRDALAAVGLTLLETKREDIWVCLVCRHDADAPHDLEALRRVMQKVPPIGSDGDWSN